MTLQQAAHVVSIVSGIAVAISLLYLTFQIRQSAKHQRGVIGHGRTAHVQLLMKSVADSPVLMETVMRGLTGDPGLTPVQVNQFYWFVSAILVTFQDTFHQRCEGMVSSLMYASAVRTMAFQLSQPGTRAVWAMTRGTFEPRFVAFIDKLMRDTPVVPAADLPERWKALAAEELRAAAA